MQWAIANEKSISNTVPQIPWVETRKIAIKLGMILEAI